MSGPIVPLSRLLAELGPRRARGERVVLTNGVFDLLHVGHLRYLRQARRLGDVLVVGVNTDAAVRSLKPGRPLVPEEERAELVGALEPVDFVVLFGEPTADRLIAAVRPCRASPPRRSSNGSAANRARTPPRAPAPPADPGDCRARYPGQRGGWS